MTAWTNDIPEEDGYYFIRWGWWSPTTEEIANVYTDEDTGTRYIARFSVEDRALPMNPPCEFWPVRLTLQPPTEETP